jgi:hypothetical protein
VSAGYKKTLYQACTFLEDGMWPPKRWEIESGHIRISSWVQGERRRRRKEIGSLEKKLIYIRVHTQKLRQNSRPFPDFLRPTF